MATLNFNAEQVEPQTPMDVLAPGKYLCMAIASELKPTKNGSGEYLQITFEVLEGAGKGRKIWDRLNIRNSNKTAEEIAQRQLSALCHAVGVIQLNDSEQLHNLPVALDIGVEEGRDGYGPQNRVKGYSAANGAAPAAAKPAAAARPAAAAGGSAKPVWKRAAA
jgi:hypothetical protein